MYRKIGMSQRRTLYLSVLGFILSVDVLTGNILVGRHGPLVLDDLGVDSTSGMTYVVEE